jgi:type II secretory pathway component PulC
LLGLALKIVQISLAAGVLVLIWMAVSPFARSQTSPTLPADYWQPESPPESPSIPRYQVISERNLFASSRAPVAAAPPIEEIVESKLNARLLGTIAGGEGNASSVAIVRDVDGSVVTVGIEDPLAKGEARVVAIEQRRVVIDHRGRLEAVLLDESERATAPRGRSVETAQREAVRDAMLQVGASSNAEMLGLMRTMSQLGRFALERDVEGNLSGIRITRFAEDSPLAELGIEIGDRVSAINGIPLMGEGAGLGAMASLSSSGDPVLTVQDASGRSREVVLPRSILERQGALP